MTTEEVAKKVVELTRKQAWYEALDTLYDDNVVSVEAYSMGGGSPETRGKEGVRGKVDWWVNSMDVHRFDAHAPFVGHDRFVVQYDAEVSDKKIEGAQENVRSRRLHREERQDRSRRISAARRLRFTRGARQIGSGARRKSSPYR